MPDTNKVINLPVFVILCGAFLLWTTTVRADAIDGDWCGKSGQHLNIDGTQIKTPGGNLITGNYERHAFSYTLPEGERHAPGTINMQMQSEDLIVLTLPDGVEENWRRCEVVS